MCRSVAEQHRCLYQVACFQHLWPHLGLFGVHRVTQMPRETARRRPNALFVTPCGVFDSPDGRV